MTAEGNAAKRDRRFGIVILSFIGLFLLLFVAAHVFALWKGRASARVQKQSAWIRDAVIELEKQGPPANSPATVSSGCPWITESHLTFSNGWAAYRLNTIHTEEAVGDIALLRLSDGRFYSSKLHYCTGIGEMMLHGEETNSPANAKDFLGNYGSRQQWNLLSPDGEIWCVVTCPDADRARKAQKKVWVSIHAKHSEIETNLFERNYPVSGKYVAWNTQLTSNAVTVELFAFAHNPMTHSISEPPLPSNHLATLRFQRDKQTGKFVEVP